MKTNRINNSVLFNKKVKYLLIVLIPVAVAFSTFSNRDKKLSDNTENSQESDSIQLTKNL